MADSEEIPVRYGRRKLSAEAYAAQAASKTLSSRGATKYGSRKGGPSPVVDAPPAKDPKDPAVEVDKTPVTKPPFNADASIADLGKVLAKRAGLLDAAIDLEFKRPAPRKGAIALFLEIENKRKGGPRADVVARLTSLTTAT